MLLELTGTRVFGVIRVAAISVGVIRVRVTVIRVIMVWGY